MAAECADGAIGGAIGTSVTSGTTGRSAVGGGSIAAGGGCSGCALGVDVAMRVGSGVGTRPPSASAES